MPLENINELTDSGFRILNQVPLWGADIRLDSERTVRVQDIIVNISSEKGFSCFGYLVWSEGRVHYHISRYPRLEYGIPADDAELEELKGLVTERIDGSELMVARPFRFSVVLGRREGYGTGLLHSIDEFREGLGNAFSLEESLILTVRNTGDGITMYGEPAVLVQGDSFPEIFRLAEKFKQERFALEDNVEGIAYMIETPSCTTPDPVEQL